MDAYNLKNDVKVFGVEVRNFPNGIGEAFEKLMKMLPVRDKRSYYGIFEMDRNGRMHYYATAEETRNDEADTYKCNRYTIERGEYLAEPLNDWQKKTDCIKDVFEKMSHDSRVDPAKPGVEWYKNDKEMWCMLKALQ